MPNIKVFISYSHDSEEHEQRVQSLADYLNTQEIDCWIDQSEEGTMDEGWAAGTQKLIEEAQIVLAVCTESYLERTKVTEGEMSGVAWEAKIIRNILVGDSSITGSFIPILFSDDDSKHIPNYLDKLSQFTVASETDYKKLADHLKSIAKKKETKTVKGLPLFNIPIHPNRFFTGREDILKQLRENLVSGKQTALTQAISGLGGVGKTQTAAEYAHRYKDSYQAVFWIDAESETSLANSVANIALRLGLPQKDESEWKVVQQAVQNWLSSHNDWLLVLDNLEDMNLYKSFVPTSAQGHVLITTRLNSTGKIKKLKILEMKEDGILFLLRRSGAIEEDQETKDAKAKDLDSAKKVNELFGGLALALEQAGAYVKENEISLVEYLELYQSSGSQLLAEHAEDSDYQDPVTKAFDLSIQKTRENSPASYELISICAFYDPYSIPEIIFKDGYEFLDEDLKKATSDDLKWNKVVKEACQFSLLQRNKDEESFRMHRLIQQAVRDNQISTKETALKAINTLSSSFPDAEDFKNWELCGRLIPSFHFINHYINKWHLETLALIFLYSQAGIYFQNAQSHYEKAESLYKAALKTTKKLLGDQDPYIAASLNNLAQLYTNQGRYDEAEQVHKASLEISIASVPQHPHNITMSLNNLAQVYTHQGRYKEAESLYKEVLNMQEKLPEKNDLIFAMSLNDLATLYNYQERYEEAEKLIIDALGICKKLPNEEHPDIATFLNNLAVIYENQKRYKDAEMLYNEILKIRIKLLGKEHHYVATSLNNLGMFYSQTGAQDKAIDYLTQAFELLSKTLGTEHPDTKMTLENFELVRSRMKAE